MYQYNVALEIVFVEFLEHRLLALVTVDGSFHVEDHFDTPAFSTEQLSAKIDTITTATGGLRENGNGRICIHRSICIKYLRRLERLNDALNRRIYRLN